MCLFIMYEPSYIINFTNGKLGFYFLKLKRLNVSTFKVGRYPSSPHVDELSDFSLLLHFTVKIAGNMTQVIIADN